MLDTATPSSSSVIAFVTTIHAALLMIHLQRVQGVARLAGALPSVAFGVLAWVLSPAPWLAAGVAANLLLTALWPRAVRDVTPPPTNPAPAGQAFPARESAAPSASPAFVPAQVLAVIEESESIRTFRLARPRGFEFAPGQFLMVRVPVDGVTHARCYSISSSPSTRGYLEISVRRQGLVSRALHEGVRPGDQLLVHPPLGQFTLPPDDSRLVLVAGGIGITPLMSMLRHTVTDTPTRPVALLYSVRSPRDAAFRQELECLAARHRQFRLLLTTTGDDAPPGWRHGRLDEEWLREGLGGGVVSFCLCGPLPMIEWVRDVLGRLAVPRDRVRFEAFEAAAALAAGGAKSPVSAGAPGRLRLSRSRCEIDARGDETLLEAAERAGGAIDSLCRAGVCGTCRTRLLSGNVAASGEALSEEERRRGYILPCVTYAAGDCVLEA